MSYENLQNLENNLQDNPQRMDQSPPRIQSWMMPKNLSCIQEADEFYEKDKS